MLTGTFFTHYSQSQYCEKLIKIQGYARQKNHEKGSLNKGSHVGTSHKMSESVKDAKNAKTIESNKSGGSATRSGMSGR